MTVYSINMIMLHQN